MTAPADLAEVLAALALVAQATPGPWRTFGQWPHLAVVSGSGRPRIVASLASASDAVDDTPKDAAAIVALRNAAPAIAAAVEELDDARAEIASAREQLDRLRSAVDERDGDMHMRIRAGYDKTVADAWRAVVAQRDAEIAALNRQVCRLVSGQEIDGDLLCQHHGADVEALAQVARYREAAVAVATEIGGPLGPVDDDPEERAAAFVRFAESLAGRVAKAMAEAEEHGRWKGRDDLDADPVAWFAEVYGQGAPGPVHAVHVIGDDGRTVAVTGNGPRSAAHAKFLAWSSPGNVSKLLRDFRAMRDRAIAAERLLADERAAHAETSRDLDALLTALGAQVTPGGQTLESCHARRVADGMRRASTTQEPRP